MKTAYKMGDGKKIEGRRVLVDVERGRTVPNWYAQLSAFVHHTQRLMLMFSPDQGVTLIAPILRS